MCNPPGRDWVGHDPKGQRLVYQIRKEGKEGYGKYPCRIFKGGAICPYQRCPMIDKQADASMSENKHTPLPPPRSVFLERRDLSSSLNYQSDLSTGTAEQCGPDPSHWFNRRGFLGLVAGILWWWMPKRSIGGPEGPSKGLSEAFSSLLGSVLEYKASCHLLEDFASGRLWMQRINSTNQYLIAMETRLHGIAGVISLQRTDLMVSLVEWRDAKGRFVPVWHADQVSRQGAWKRKVLVFEDGAKSCREWRLSPHKGTSRVTLSGGRPLQDPLCAFLNWRAGAYGPLKPGQKFVIDDLARKEPVRLTVEVLPEAEALKKRPPDKGDWTFYVQAYVDKEVAESIQGSLEGWLDGQWVPVFARSTNVRIVGEVWARLAGRWKLPQPERPVAPEPPLQSQKWTIT